MSKSLNNVVDPTEYVDKYGRDALRYYLLKEIPTTDDGDFSLERFNVVYESELANNIGNLVSRVLAMTVKYFDSRVPQADRGEGIFGPEAEKVWRNYERAIEAFDLKKALEQVVEFSGYANKFVDDTKPWVLAKTNQNELARVIYALLEMVRQIALLLLPFLPETAEKIFGYLGVDVSGIGMPIASKWGLLEQGSVVKKAEPLFGRISE